MDMCGGNGNQPARTTARFSDSPTDRCLLHHPQHQNADQNHKPRSWFFWRGHSEEEASHNRVTHPSFPTGHYGAGGDHQEHHHGTKEQPALTVSRAKSGEAVEGEEDVDKEAEDFIQKMRQRMDMERLKSLQRYESMINREC